MKWIFYTALVLAGFAAVADQDADAQLRTVGATVGQRCPRKGPIALSRLPHSRERSRRGVVSHARHPSPRVTYWWSVGHFTPCQRPR